MTDIIEVDGVMFDEGKVRHYRGMVDQYDHERQQYKYCCDLLTTAAENLIISVMSRYELESEDELTCPYMKDLAVAVEKTKEMIE